MFQDPVREPGSHTDDADTGQRLWPLAFARQNHCLHAGEDLARPVSRDRCPRAMCEGLEEGQELHPLVDGKLGDLLDAQST
jgi:hypothetical protein